jgi:hypothetical protein
MLISDCFLLLAQGQWGQPTALGFSVFVGGLVLASLRDDEEEEEEESEVTETPTEVPAYRNS